MRVNSAPLGAHDRIAATSSGGSTVGLASSLGAPLVSVGSALPTVSVSGSPSLVGASPGAVAAWTAAAVGVGVNARAVNPRIEHLRPTRDRIPGVWGGGAGRGGRSPMVGGNPTKYVAAWKVREGAEVGFNPQQLIVLLNTALNINFTA